MKSLQSKVGSGLLKNIEQSIKRIWGKTEDSAGSVLLNWRPFDVKRKLT